MASTDRATSTLAEIGGAAVQQSDPVSLAAALGRQHKGERETNLRDALAEARDLLAQARRDGGFRASFPRLLELIKAHPEAADLQLTAARLLMESGDSGALRSWAGVHNRFPEAPEPFRMMVRLTLRQSGKITAAAVVNKRFPAPDAVSDEPGLLALAFAHQELGDPAHAETIFRRATQFFPHSSSAWRQLVRLQEERGALLTARRSVSQAAALCGGDGFRLAHARLDGEIRALEEFSPSAMAEDIPLSVRVLKAVLNDIVKSRSTLEMHPRHHLGSTMMITGSLGPGGAERQMTATVLGLHGAVQQNRRVSGYEIAGPVIVACRTLARKHDNDFFLGDLASEGVQVTEYGRLPAFGGLPQISRARRFAKLLEFLPLRMREGVRQLVEFIRLEAPDVVNIWQDGMIFATGLAVLIAGAPRIVLSVRTLPPTDRVSRWRHELEPIYRALLSSRGVVMTANAQFTARRYEDWLQLPHGAVTVIPNGVSTLPADGDKEAMLLFQSFHSRTSDADFTLGAVMRLDENKRPMEWLSVAEQLLKQHPRARFVIVGDGALRMEAAEYAGRLGISDRVLFAGRSAAVGFWLSHMDALMLLSRYEGMPNVLIEAQLAQVPVITTPAGGAAEAVLPGVTGFVLASADRVDIDEAVRCILDLVKIGAAGRSVMGAAAQAWAKRAFAVDTMLERTVETFMHPSDRPLLASP